jgi:hypothetical protein
LHPGLPDARVATMEPSKTEIDPAGTPLIQRIGASSIAEIEKLIGELQQVRNFLESEGERIQREAAGCIDLIQRALASLTVISDTLSGWRQAGHPFRGFVKRGSPAEDN